MSCSHPLYMIKRGVKDNGKQDLIFANQVQSNLGLSTDELLHRYGDRIVPVPCGKCIGCKLDRAKEWSVRCVLESMVHESNSFLTLTYDDAHLPKRLIKKHLSGFIKRLRARHPELEIRFFGCGEHGEESGRIHYHCLVFGYDFPDKVFHSKSDLGDSYFTSDELASLWPVGLHLIGDVSLESCSYVARYTVKKTAATFPDEFILMSRRPGLGYEWFQKNKDRIYLSDHVYGKFGKSHRAKVPTYFDKLAEKDGIDLATIKEDRVYRAQCFTELYKTMQSCGHMEALNDKLEDLLISKIRLLRRGL